MLSVDILRITVYYFDQLTKEINNNLFILRPLIDLDSK